MSAPFTLTVTFHTRVASGVDAYRNVTYSTTDVSVDGCVFAPGGSTEILGNRDTVLDQPTLYCPAVAAAQTAVDSVTVPGFGDFEVDGRPDAYPVNPWSGWLPDQSVVVKLRAVTG